MTPLEAARAMLADRPILGGSRLKSAPDGHCYYCSENWRDEPHAPDCPWRVMPRIVTVLEAAEALIASSRKFGDGDPGTYELIVLSDALKGDAV